MLSSARRPIGRALPRILCGLLLALLASGCSEGVLRRGGDAGSGWTPPLFDTMPWSDRGVPVTDAGFALDVPPPPPPPPPDLGPTPDQGPGPFVGTPVVWIVGDSLAVGAGGPSQTMLGGKYNLTVRAVVGSPISYAKGEVLNAMAAGAHAIVIQSGINNVGGGTANVSALTNEIGATLDSTVGARCVFWVTYQSVYTQGYLKLNNSAPALNQVIRNEVAKRLAWVGLIDFQPYIDAHPELNAGDGLHLNGGGYNTLATFYRDALSACFGF